MAKERMEQKDGGERHTEHCETDRKQEEDAGTKEEEVESREPYDEEHGQPIEQQAVTDSGGSAGRSYYITIPVRLMTRSIPDEFLERVMLYYTLYGVVFGALGAIAIVLPVVFGVAIFPLLPWLLVLGGSVTLLICLLICGAPGTIAFLLLCRLHLAAGLFLLYKPPSTTDHLTYFLAGWFLLHGALKLFMAFAVRKIAAWPAVLVSGIAAIGLAFVIVALVPRFGLEIVAIAFGADLAFTGISMILISIMGIRGISHRSVSDSDLVNEPLLQNNSQP